MRKKDPKTCFREFKACLDEIRDYLKEIGSKKLSSDTTTRCYQYALIYAYREFEHFILDICIAKINRNPTIFYKAVDVDFGKHVTAEQCEFLLVGDGYFDFRGHDGLIRAVRKVAGDGNPMLDSVKGKGRRQLIDLLIGLRNYIAHDSSQSWRSALRAVQAWEPERKRLGSAGVWLKARRAGRTRMDKVLNELETMCRGIANAV